MIELPNEIVGDVILYLTPWKIEKLGKINPIFSQLKEYINFNPEFPYKYKDIKVYRFNSILKAKIKPLILNEKSLRDCPLINYYSYKDVKWKNTSLRSNLSSNYGFNYLIQKIGPEKFYKEYNRDFIIRNLDVKKEGKDTTPLMIKIMGNNNILSNWITNNKRYDHPFIYACAQYMDLNVNVCEINGTECNIEELLFSFDIGFSEKLYNILNLYCFYYKSGNNWIESYGGFTRKLSKIIDITTDCKFIRNSGKNISSVKDNNLPRMNKFDMESRIYRETVNTHARVIKVSGKDVQKLFDIFPYYHPDHEIYRGIIVTNPPTGSFTVKSMDFIKAKEWFISMGYTKLHDTGYIVEYLPTKREDIDRAKERINSDIDGYVEIRDILG